VLPSRFAKNHGPRAPDGTYLGEVSFRLSYGGIQGSPYPWLFVDPRTFERYADAADFSFTVESRGSRGAYLARLIRV
jgi:hypothetical protein